MLIRTLQYGCPPDKQQGPTMTIERGLSFRGHDQEDYAYRAKPSKLPITGVVRIGYGKWSH